ncbi:unnamed protein product [Parnassius apollo]|uniref:(apollo) hypothetical protein n=1 Tax=Parnassius apollo TaxID=110799 RepID=A0A8S3X4K6_PARAO|nr:unnamed protein product [Parnassius apollo]
MRLFLKRNPELAKRKAQFLNPARAQKLNKPIVFHHFEQVKKLYDELKLHNHPEKNYNMDEKGCRLTLHHQQTVISQKGAKRVHIQVAEHGENVTVVGCANAIGNPVPPMILFKGKRKMVEYEKNLPPGSIVQMDRKGSMTTDLFIIFIKHLAKYKTFGKCLLIFDDAKCHLDFRIVEEAEKNDIVLYCLPSNTTHEVATYGQDLFQPFETYWDQEVLQFLYETRAKAISKQQFNKILTRVWAKCMTTANITSGFSASGLYPLNPNAISETAFAPSILTQRSIHSVLSNENEVLGHPSPNSDTAMDTHEDSCSSPPIATLRELRDLIATEILPGTPDTPDIQVFENYSSVRHTPAFADDENLPWTSGIHNKQSLVAYSDTDESSDTETKRKFVKSKVISKFLNRPLPVRRLRIYSSTDSETDVTNDGSKVVSVPQSPQTFEVAVDVHLSPKSKINQVPERSEHILPLSQHSKSIISASPIISYLPRPQCTSTSPRNSSQDSPDEDNVSLAQISTKSPFQKFMPTPDYGDIKTRPRKKALKYKGQRVTKDLFKIKDTKVGEKKAISDKLKKNL